MMKSMEIPLITRSNCNKEIVEISSKNKTSLQHQKRLKKSRSRKVIVRSQSKWKMLTSVKDMYVPDMNI